MELDNAHLTDKAAFSPTPRQPGLIRRFFSGWKRLEEAMDYTPYDYVADRLIALEARVIELETRLDTLPPTGTAGVINRST